MGNELKCQRCGRPANTVFEVAGHLLCGECRKLVRPVTQVSAQAVMRAAAPAVTVTYPDKK